MLLAVTTLSFDIAGLEIYLPLISGARLVIASGDDVVDGPRLRDLLSRQQSHHNASHAHNMASAHRSGMAGLSESENSLRR